MSNYTYTQYTRDDFDTIPAQHPAPVETWIVAINCRWMTAYTYTPAGGDAVTAFDKAREYYASEPEALPLVAMTRAQFFKWEAMRMHARSKLEPCTAERFDEMLNVLPPLRWERSAGVERFCMSEMYHGTWTHQFARVGELYASKLVDMRDRSTWITAKDVLAINAATA